MARWIAFDQETSSLLRSTLTPNTAVETLGRGALDYALAKPGAVVTLLPSAEGNAALAVFRPPRRIQPVPQQPERLAVQTPSPEIAAAYARHEAANRVTRAGGFLGLSDEPIFEEEPSQEKKGWWRKFWDE
jgi:hypothetical protein